MHLLLFPFVAKLYFAGKTMTFLSLKSCKHEIQIKLANEYRQSLTNHKQKAPKQHQLTNENLPEKLVIQLTYPDPDPDQDTKLQD